MDLVKQGVDYIYNYNFEQSQAVIEQLESRLPGSAIPDLMKAMQVFWRLYPIHFKENELALYEEYLERAYSRSMKVLEEDRDNPEAIFLTMASQGLLAESYSEAGRSFKAVGAAKRAYSYLKDGTTRMDQYKEFYLSTGLYNYYREYYPEAHPVYRPFMSFFMKGDKKIGIQQLEIAASQASIAHVIAKYYLSYIYMRYEYLPLKALKLGHDLHESYPNNPLFSAIYLESLIINHKYRDATPIAVDLQSNANPYLRIYGDLFMGVIEEKNRNYSLAEQLYRKTLEMSDVHDMERDNLEAYAYLGLGRIYQMKKDAPQARKYFKECLDRTYSEAVKNEAKSYLN
jgi:tetratricopeptide (TPR) repeat protein